MAGREPWKTYRVGDIVSDFFDWRGTQEKNLGVPENDPGTGRPEKVGSIVAGSSSKKVLGGNFDLYKDLLPGSYWPAGEVGFAAAGCTCWVDRGTAEEEGWLGKLAGVVGS